MAANKLPTFMRLQSPKVATDTEIIAARRQAAAVLLNLPCSDDGRYRLTAADLASRIGVSGHSRNAAEHAIVQLVADGSLEASPLDFNVVEPCPGFVCNPHLQELPTDTKLDWLQIEVASTDQLWDRLRLQQETTEPITLAQLAKLSGIPLSTLHKHTASRPKPLNRTKGRGGKITLDYSAARLWILNDHTLANKGLSLPEKYAEATALLHRQ